MTADLEQRARDWRKTFDDKYRGTTLSERKLAKLLDKSLTDLLTRVQAEARLAILRDCEDKYDTLDGAPFESWLDREIDALAQAAAPVKETQRHE